MKDDHHKETNDTNHLQNQSHSLMSQIFAAQNKARGGNQTKASTMTSQKAAFTRPTKSEIAEISKPERYHPPASTLADLTKEFGILTLEEQRRLGNRRPEPEKRTKKKRTKTERNNQVKTRLTDAELLFFKARVETSGMTQGEFMRACLLQEQIHSRKLNEIDEQLIETLMEISSDLGRIGGLIKGTVMANKGNFKVLTPEEKNLFERNLRDIIKAKNELQSVVQEIYGNP